MSDIVEDVARAIHDTHHGEGHFDNLRRLGVSLGDFSAVDVSEAAIAAARPHIRAELFDELIAEAESKRFVGDGDEIQSMFDFVDRKWFTFPDWIRARMDRV